MSGIRSFRVDKGSHTNAQLRGDNTWAKIRNEVTQAKLFASFVEAFVMLLFQYICKLRLQNL